jgi:hypothetical protein
MQLQFFIEKNVIFTVFLAVKVTESDACQAENACTINTFHLKMKCIDCTCIVLTLGNLLTLLRDTSQKGPSSFEEMLQNQPATPADFLNLGKFKINNKN